MNRLPKLLPILVMLATGCAALNDPQAHAVRRDMSHAVAFNMNVTFVLPTGPLKKEASGSGVVVDFDRKGNSSLVLTAAHVCSPPAVIFGGPLGQTQVVPILDSITVENQLGVHLRATVLYTNREADVCFVATDGWAGTPAEIARELPPRGALLTLVGAPDGVFGNNLFYAVQGYLVGHARVWGSVYTMTSAPGAAGMSGGAYFYRGRIVSLLSRVDKHFQTETYGAYLNNIVVGEVLARKAWRMYLGSPR